MEAVKTNGLTKYYGKSRGIVGLDLSVEKGEFFGFIGPNGAGKSTTIRTLLGLLTPTSGTASVLGMDIEEDKVNIASKVGYLPSEAVFYPQMRVREVLKLSADLRRTDCGSESDRLCQRLQLDPAKRIRELSFGNRKKVGIVCALQSRPELLILDEPTGGLDPLMQKEFFEILRERHEEGATIFLSSHVLSEIQRNCSRAAIIRDGRIIACDRVEALAKTSAKRVTIHFEAPGPVKMEGLSGVRDLQQSGSVVSCLYQGDIGELLVWLGQRPIKDLSLAEPDLEEIFLHYYVEGGEA